VAGLHAVTFLAFNAEFLGLVLRFHRYVAEEHTHSMDCSHIFFTTAAIFHMFGQSILSLGHWLRDARWHKNVLV